MLIVTLVSFLYRDTMTKHSNYNNVSIGLANFKVCSVFTLVQVHSDLLFFFFDTIAKLKCVTCYLKGYMYVSHNLSMNFGLANIGILCVLRNCENKSK